MQIVTKHLAFVNMTPKAVQIIADLLLKVEQASGGFPAALGRELTHEEDDAICSVWINHWLYEHLEEYNG